MSAFRIALIVAALLISADDSRAEAQYGKIIYHAPSKRHFELVKVTRAESKAYIPEFNWKEADAAARRRTYKGNTGRLASIDSAELHEFVMEKLQPDEWTWIGLRYFCKLRKLQWSSGKSLDRGAFQAWHSQWDQSAGAGCVKGGGEADWMPVVYSPMKEGLRWVAKGALKKYYAYIVEYPDAGK
jgi:hypothetical protein